MNYQRQYNLLVEKYKKLDLKRKGFPKGALEEHHIKPTGLGGGNEIENKVMFTAKAHFTAHHLLAEIHGGGQWHAFWMMCHTRDGLRITSRVFDKLRREHGKLMVEIHTGNGALKGMQDSPENIIHRKLKERCYSKNCPQYKYYGGKGITMYESWLGLNGQGFNNFYADMGNRPEGMVLSRIDVNGNFEPSNCIWTDMYFVANNKTNNHKLTYNGVTKNITEWAVGLGINYKTLFTRIYDGWSVERALSTTTTKAKKYTYKGNTKTVEEWAEDLNVSTTLLYSRLSKGWTVDEVFSTPVTKAKVITYKGTSRTIKQWCEYLDCSRKMIESRLREGKNDEVTIDEVIHNIAQRKKC